MTQTSPREQLADWIRTACVLEATARKPGNVHPEAAFADASHAEFVRSAEVIAPILARTDDLGVGAAILESVEATMAAVGKNTNLGIILLLAPLAAVPSQRKLQDGIGDVLARTTVSDSQQVYRAIRRAHPGGLGSANQEDVADEPTLPLVDVMRLAAERDRIARQYANGFADVLGFGVETLAAWTRSSNDWETSVIGLHLTLMAELPDTLIARKCGTDVAHQAAQRAQAVLSAGWPDSFTGGTAFQRLDQWLRSDGNRLNPGTTADLVAATLFAAMRDDAWRPTGTTQ